jgi:hypothetical protein
MADTVTTDVQYAGSRRYVAEFTNVSDGTGESAVQKIDISGLTGAPTAVRILKAKWRISGMSVKVLFDHTTDDTALILTGTGDDNYMSFGGIKDPGSSGGTGDILFTTVGAAANDTYSITLELGLS